MVAQRTAVTPGQGNVSVSLVLMPADIVRNCSDESAATVNCAAGLACKPGAEI